MTTSTSPTKRDRGESTNLGYEHLIPELKAGWVVLGVTVVPLVSWLWAGGRLVASLGGDPRAARGADLRRSRVNDAQLEVQLGHAGVLEGIGTVRGRARARMRGRCAHSSSQVCSSPIPLHTLACNRERRRSTPRSSARGHPPSWRARSAAHASRLASLRGRVIVLSFFASCRAAPKRPRSAAFAWHEHVVGASAALLGVVFDDSTAWSRKR